jgi:hypothetical protein
MYELFQWYFTFFLIKSPFKFFETPRLTHLKIQLFQDIFWYGHQQYGYFLQRSSYRRKAAASSSEGDPLQALLEGDLDQQAASQL